MKVTTSTPQLEAMRKEIISLLLSDHPYEECLTCEKSGSCELQEKAYSCRVELPGLIRELPVTQDENPYIVRDESKCILCGRCLRVCRDYAGRNVFALLSGGIESRITPCLLYTSFSSWKNQLIDEREKDPAERLDLVELNLPAELEGAPLKAFLGWS